MEGYDIACRIWFCGVIFFTIYDVVRTMLARRALQQYGVCEDARIKAVCADCAGLVHMKKVPDIYFGTLEDPACVAGALKPAIILNKEMIMQLTDTELMTVLCHEITHIKRRHILLGRIYDYICILNWMNPLAWIAKKEFAVHCEMDCDCSVLVCLESKLTVADYAGSMVRLLELSAIQSGSRACGMSALGFLLAKRRVEWMMYKPTRRKNIIATSALVILLAMIILFSAWLSRAHFYPYPAYQTLPEYSSGYQAVFFCFINLQM